MKSAVSKAICLSAAAVVCLAGAAFGTANLPYRTGFEASWSLNDPWSAVGSGVVEKDAVRVTGALGLSITDDAVSLGVTPGTYGNVWMHVFAQPVAGTANPPVPAVSGAFYVRTDGELMAYTDLGGGNNDWKSVGTGIPTSGTQWIGFIIHADYVMRAYDVYYTTGAFGLNMERANPVPIAFASTAPTHMQSFSVQSGNQTHIDVAGVSRGFSPVGVCSKVKPYPYVAAERRYNHPLPVYGDTYIGAGNNLLSGTVGDDLRGGLQTGDKIKIYGTVSTFYEYLISGGAWGPVGSAPLPGEMAILPSTVIELVRNAGSDETFGFFPYNDVVNEDGGKPPVAIPYPETMHLYGTANGHTGFTAVNWPAAAANVNALPFKNPDADLIHGDRLFLQNRDVPGRYDEHWFDAVNNRWMFWAQVPDTALPGKANMWIKRQQDDITEEVQVTF